MGQPKVAIGNAKHNLTYASCGNDRNDTKKLNSYVVMEMLLNRFPRNHVRGARYVF